MDGNNKSDRPQHPRALANVFEIITFSWLLDIFKTGLHRNLEENDLYATLNDHKSSLLGDKLESTWKCEMDMANKVNQKPSLLRALIKTFGDKYVFYGCVLFINEMIVNMYRPLLISGLLAYFNPVGTDKISLKYAYIYAFGLVLNILTSMILFHSSQIELAHCGMKIRVACCSAIFRKALRLSNTALSETTVGQVVNILSNDVNHFNLQMHDIHFLWIGPLQTSLVTYFLWQEVGVSSVFGVTSLLMFIPLQFWLGKKTSEFRNRTIIKSDERIRLMQEIISGINVIKMYTWEKPFAYLVKCARRMEIHQIRGSSYVKCAWLSFAVFQSRIALFFSIVTYALLGNFITAQKVFVIASYYTILQLTMTTYFPRGIGKLADVLITIKRIQNFLLCEEKSCQITNCFKFQKVAHNARKSISIIDNGKPNSNENQNDSVEISNLAVVMRNVTSKWTESQVENTLENINLTVKSGNLIAVIGNVGAGKSSLIQAILRELTSSEGNITVRGILSYASQEPWLFTGSVQQNILFGLPMVKDRYERVIDVCALKTDFRKFPYSDKTIVGEKGILLSGGQRARINLARAIYKPADIYLLDDPLSAVDTRVGKHLFEQCIKGYLKGKTRVLITHQLQYLTKADRIIIMDNAKILAEGSYIDLQESGIDFMKMLGSSKSSVNESVIEPFNENDTFNSLDKQTVSSRKQSIQSISSVIYENESRGQQTVPHEVPENRFPRKISKKVYLSYLCAGGSVFKTFFVLLMCIFVQLMASGGDYWMVLWVNIEEKAIRNMNSVYYNITPSTVEKSYASFRLSTSRKMAIVVFSILTILLIIATLIRSATFISMCLKASVNLHNLMFNSITRATMNFFNSNSSGRILNRFSNDMGSVDTVVPIYLLDFIQCGLKVIGIIIIVTIVNVHLMIPALIVVIIVYKLRSFYLSTSRSIKRLEGVTRSPMFSHLNASLYGLTTIRAFEAEQIISNEFDKHQDLHSSAWYLHITSSRAFAFWSDFVCLVYISIVIFSFLVITNNQYISGENVGLAIIQSIKLLSVQYVMRLFAELEIQITAVERVMEYINVPKEADLESLPDKKPSNDWPQKGQLTFKNFYLRYNLDAPYVLTNLNFNIEPMEKVGIVGRTGAGKSSLIGALFRLALNEGEILIDNMEIHDLGLHDLRSKISIIPQEPVLFAGTVRKNLDPFDEYPDHVLWNALDEVELKDVIEDLPDGLNSKVFKSGSNFSVGQKQLICLARAIVRNNRIIVMDEATANVDPRTDRLIQNTIRNKFHSCTVLTVAHRLNTVMDSDKVLVMDGGQMIEFDHPFNLLKNKDGIFSKMVEQTGQDTADILQSVAAENYIKRKLLRS